MRKIYVLLLFWLTCSSIVQAQTFPLVIVNSDQGSQTQGTLGIYANANGPSNQLTRFNVGSKLVASAPLITGTPVTGSNGTTTSSYWHVDIPGTSGPRMGYVAAGSTFSNPDCGSNYIYVNSSSLAITANAGGSAYVTISGAAAKIFSGQSFAIKSSRTIGSVTYYEIYLTIECSISSGWVSGAGGSVNVGSSNGISAPILSSSGYNGAAVDLGWMMTVQPGGLVPTSFDIYRSINNGPATVIKTQSQNAYTDNSLTATNAYTYYIAARYGNCATQNSNSQTVGPSSTPCNLTVSVSGNTNVSCGQTISLTANASASGVSYSWTGPNNYSSSAASISIPNAANINAGNYSVTVSKSGCTNGSTQQTIAVNGCSTPVCTSYPVTPTGGISVTISSSEIDLGWQSVSGAARYRIYDCNGALIGTSQTNSYQATGLMPATRYDFKLTAVNSQGCESQIPSACFNSTTMSTTATTYTVSGKITTSAGSAITGATVVTGSYSSTTNATGNYRIANIPESYSGSVSASLVGYTFSPASRAISGTNDANKDFVGTFISGATYNITGLVTTAAGQPVAGVTVSTNPPGTSYFGISGVNGKYSITVPATYAGFVSPSASGYSFTTASFTVNPQNHDHRDFMAVPTLAAPKITILSTSEIPPWQRENDAFKGVVNVDLTKAQGKSWYLEIDVYQPGATTPTDFVKYNPTTADKIFFDSSDSQLAALIRNKKLTNGCRLTYNAILSPIASPPEIAYYAIGTNITEAIWDKENKVYFNGDPFNNLQEATLKLPVKFISNVQSIKVTFDINTYTCSNGPAKLQLTTASLPYSAQDLSSSIVNINNNSSNIKNSTILPGEYSYRVQYLNGNQVVDTDIGSFELIKIGRCNYQMSSKVVVFIGGWNSTIQHDVENVFNYSSGSTEGFSIAKYSEWQANNFATWYIGQSGANYTQRNGYSVGKALDEILAILGSNNVTEIDLIGHSKAGLDIRALIGGYGVSFKNMPPIFADVAGPRTSFTSFKCSSKIKRIVFLSTPHNGANSLADVASFTGSPLLAASPAVRELGKQSGFKIIDRLNSNAKIPDGIEIGNVTAYESTPILANNIILSYAFNFSDGVVPGESSDCISTEASVLNSNTSLPLHNTSNHLVPVFQMYQHSDFIIPHVKIHTTATLNKTTPSIYSNINLTNYYSNLDKIVLFTKLGFSGQLVTCPRPQVSAFYIAAIKSALSGATLSFKLKNDSRYYKFGVTDENGHFNATIIPALPFWDSIRVEANNVDPLTVPVGSQFINSRKLNIAMFKSATASNRVLYPSLSLIQQTVVTNEDKVKIKATGINVNNFQVNQHNSDSTFVPLQLSGNLATVGLDVGYNKIIVRYLGVDTAALVKEVYYYPDSLMKERAKDLVVSAQGSIIGAKMFVNNNYFTDLKIANSTIKILSGINQVKFSRFGYRDTLINVDSVNNINLQMVPYSYSSLTDSSVYDFNSKLNPQYWKNVTLKNISATSNVQVSARQYDDVFKETGLKPQTRKFVFRNLTSNLDVRLRAAIALDQAETPNVDSIYLLSIKNGKYTKYEANKTGLSEYDPEVQKLAFDSLALKANESQEIVLVKKQAPIALDPGVVSLAECQSQGLPSSMFVKDPDSLKNDLSIKPLTPGVAFSNNIVSFTRSAGHTGPFSFKLAVTHDFITIEKTYTVDLTPCPVIPPNAFTPNSDGINDTWNIPELSNFSNCTVEIFVRSGSRVFHSNGYGKAWDGTYGGKRLPAGVYYYIIDLKTPGYTKVTGDITIIR